jgi:DNA-binding IclR family transcriptional regulator
MTTVHRLAVELVDHGALEMTDRGAYRVGPWLWEVATLSARSRNLRDVAISFMEDLYEATHENVHLGVLEGHEALIVEKIRGRNSVTINSRVGGRLPLHATGVGKAILAFCPPSFHEEVIAAGLEGFTPCTITDPVKLRRELENVRRRGYALSIGEMTENAAAVAAPIFDGLGDVIGAVSLIVDVRRAEPGRLTAPVRTVALGISRVIASRAG